MPSVAVLPTDQADALTGESRTLTLMACEMAANRGSCHVEPSLQHTGGGTCLAA